MNLPIPTPTTIPEAAFLHLLQLASPSLPIGAYSYSEGIEALVTQGIIQNHATLAHWLTQELHQGAIRLEAAMMLRAYQAAQGEDWEKLRFWNDWTTAAKETEELRHQSWQMGRSLTRLLLSLAPALQQPLQSLGFEGNYGIVFGVAASYWQIDPQSACLAYFHSWASNLISAAVKLVPLGQTTGQQVLIQLYPAIGETAQQLPHVRDDELSSWGWSLTLASMNHQTQYSRLFQS